MCKQVLIVALVAWMAVAVHAVLTPLQSHSGSLSESVTSQTFDFDAFDTSLGTLTDVSLNMALSGIALAPKAVNGDAGASHTVTQLTASISGEVLVKSDDGLTTLDDVFPATRNYNSGTISQVVPASSTYIRTGQTGANVAGVIQNVGNGGIDDLSQYTIAGAGGPQLTITAILFTSAGGSSDAVTQITYGIDTISLNYVCTLQYTYTAAMVGDPQIVGFQGQHFQVHGTPDEFFSLISSADYYVNSKFVYMATGVCNYNDTECFSHPGTYIGEIGLVADSYKVKITSGSHSAGLKVFINEKPAPVGARVKINNSTAVHVVSFNRVSLTTADFKLNAVNSDSFLNLGVDFTNNGILHAGHVKVTIDGSASPAEADKKISKAYPEFAMHGLLGQTWRNIVWPHARLYQGEPADYQVANLFSSEFLYTQFSS